MFSCAARRGVLLLCLLAILDRPAATFGQVPARVPTELATLDAAPPPAEPAPLAEPFGNSLVAVTSGELLIKWNTLKAEIAVESEILARCRADAEPCPAAAQKFLAIVAEGQAHDGRGRIGVINRAVNLAIRPTSDLAQWGVPDRWSAPLATLTTGRGDCEDYAIAKYVALRAAGVAENDVRLVIVRDLAVGEDHAVVAARLDGGWIVLDNRRLVLVADSDMPHVIPLFVLDQDGIKQFAPAILAQTAAPASVGFLDVP